MRQPEHSRWLDARTWHAALLAAAVLALVVLLAVGQSLLLDTAVWPCTLGAISVGTGVLFGARELVGSGCVLFAVGGAIAIHDEPTGRGLAIGAVVVTVCLLTIVLSDLSFALRGAPAVMSQTVAGVAAVHAAAWILGLGAAVAVVAIVTSFTWPSWLLIVALSGLGVAALYAWRRLSRYRRQVREAQNPTRATHMPSTAPPPPAMQPPPPVSGAAIKRVPPPPRL